MQERVKLSPEKEPDPITPQGLKQERVKLKNPPVPGEGKINLFSCYYKGKDKQRQKELDYCHDKNIANEFIEKILTFDGRPRYDDFFEQSKAFPDDINIFANADIYFNDTVEYMRFIKPEECYAITRWENVDGIIMHFEERNPNNAFAQAKFSQDVWAFRGGVYGVYGGFYSGIPGCDNRIAAELDRKYVLYNPCNTIQCIHKHDIVERDYHIPEGELPQVPKPWKWVEPCSISPEGRYFSPAKNYEAPKYDRINRKAI